MIHLTLNTGHARTSPRHEVADHVIRALAGQLAAGEHALPGPPGYRVRVMIEGRGLLATVSAADGRPLVTFGVAPDDEAGAALWPALERHYLELTDRSVLGRADFAAPRPPESTPWCAAVVILPTPDEAAWVGDYERCLAWSWLERYAAAGGP